MGRKSKPILASVTDNDDGTVTITRYDDDGDAVDTDPPDPTQTEVLVQTEGRPKGPMAKLGGSDCAWCRYGKPAVAGAVAGLALAALTGYEPTRGVVWGGVGGLLYGHVRG